MASSGKMINISNVSKLVHDKVTYNGPFKAMQYNCEGALNALAVNKDFSQVVVAGRAVFKILNIKEDCFTENTNLRVSKQKSVNLNYSAADVAWHPSDENILASAATNGSVVIWNLSKSAKSKQSAIYSEHKRSVNRVMFHATEHNQLLSASRDGIVMLHDVRKASACMKFGVLGTDSVRDAQFCPPNMGYFTFAAAYDNGGVQTWDMRRPDRCERQFMAHNGPVFSLDWHPFDKTWWLATGGRDKMVKVWEMQRGSDRASMPPCLHTITNIAPVARVKWRPHRKHHISSCSQLMDHSVNVWDVGRPYIPFAAFDGHLDVATSITWRDDCHAFLSCGQDGYIIQHIFSEAKRPADDVNLAGVDLSINGDIGYAFSDKRDHTTGSLGRNKRVPRSRQFTLASSSLCFFQNCQQMEEEGEMMILGLYEIALEYKLEGGSIVDICWHNGDVAERYKKPQVAQSWRMLAVMYSPCLVQQCTSHTSRTSSSLGKLNPAPPKEHQDKATKPALKRSREKEKKKSSQVLSQSEATSGSNDDSSDVEAESSEVDKSAPELHVGTNFLFGDGELSDAYGTAGEMNADNYDWKLQTQMLPYEAFQPRHELNPMTDTHPIMMEESEMIMPAMDSLNITPEALSEPMLTIKSSHDMEAIDFSSTVADVIKSFAEQGDVQTAVSMLIVLGDHLTLHIDEAYQESWFFAYIDLLGRYELWTVSNTVIKHSKLLGVCTLNQKSTVIHTLCAKCSRSCERAPWLCDKCKRITGLCSVCHHPVKGLMVWCQGCCHGGHIEHMREWMAISSHCPAGCGHQCEYV
ncbi:GATOR complex protein WDR24 [Aplysia californica]|uniref:GATOR2 complex protein WDR24 n=1 Tax=Aplysia californica TaxID=6500 RepID=A0ABM0K2Q9_APLCA|nr:GATOR complex protein WDR24 [Aplysia californica]